MSKNQKNLIPNLEAIENKETTMENLSTNLNEGLKQPSDPSSSSSSSSNDNVSKNSNDNIDILLTQFQDSQHNNFGTATSYEDTNDGEDYGKNDSDSDDEMSESESEGESGYEYEYESDNNIESDDYDFGFDYYGNDYDEYLDDDGGDLFIEYFDDRDYSINHNQINLNINEDIDMIENDNENENNNRNNYGFEFPVNPLDDIWSYNFSEDSESDNQTLIGDEYGDDGFTTDEDHYEDRDGDETLYEYSDSMDDSDEETDDDDEDEIEEDEDEVIQDEFQFQQAEPRIVHGHTYGPRFYNGDYMLNVPLNNQYYNVNGGFNHGYHPMIPYQPAYPYYRPNQYAQDLPPIPEFLINIDRYRNEREREIRHTTRGMNSINHRRRANIINMNNEINIALVHEAAEEQNNERINQRILNFSFQYRIFQALNLPTNEQQENIKKIILEAKNVNQPISELLDLDQMSYLNNHRELKKNLEIYQELLNYEIPIDLVQEPTIEEEEVEAEQQPDQGVLEDIVDLGQNNDSNEYINYLEEEEEEEQQIINITQFQQCLNITSSTKKIIQSNLFQFCTRFIYPDSTVVYDTICIILMFTFLQVQYLASQLSINLQDCMLDNFPRTLKIYLILVIINIFLYFMFYRAYKKFSSVRTITNNFFRSFERID